jgi:drug/metabolite transporter (DMT)-like permease
MASLAPGESPGGDKYRSGGETCRERFEFGVQSRGNVLKLNMIQEIVWAIGSWLLHEALHPINERTGRFDGWRSAGFCVAAVAVLAASFAVLSVTTSNWTSLAVTSAVALVGAAVAWGCFSASMRNSKRATRETKRPAEVSVER